MFQWRISLEYSVQFLKRLFIGWAVMAFNPSTQKTEGGESLSLGTAWSIEGVSGQPRLHRETLSQKTKINQTNKKTKQKILFMDTNGAQTYM